jgi:cytosine/adenosine deaminase-related metal-dependent hydrolase
MILNNVKTVNNNISINIKTNDGKIVAVLSSQIAVAGDELQLNFNNALVFPGLINSHDHLDFNLFPQLGGQAYNNYTEWGKHIHQKYKPEIAAVLKIPVELRTKWGIYKNLLCGVTTVVNHGEKLKANDNLINVFEETHAIHSVGFEKRWKIKLNNPLKRSVPVNMHVGEGIDIRSKNEIDELIRWNLLKRKLIGVHAVAMNHDQAKKFDAIVWCPQTNYFLLDKTARIDLLKNNTNILFGTDSTLTSDWNIWDHFRSARKSQLLDDEKLYNTLNINAAKAWQISGGEISKGKNADLVVAKVKVNKTPYDAFYAITPADILLVIQNGEIKLFDEDMLVQLENIVLAAFSKIYINSICKYVLGDLPGLMTAIRKYHPAAKFPKCITIAD